MNILNCRYIQKCGACKYMGTDYYEHINSKLDKTRQTLAPFAYPLKIVGMKDPYFYRHKVTATFTLDKNGKITTGRFKENSRSTIVVDTCLIENKIADDIILKIRDLARSFKLTPFDVNTGKGVLRHLVIRIGYNTNEIMVTIVTGSSFFPSRNNFIKALIEKCPNINTIVQNINGEDTSMILGDREMILYGKGFITDKICGNTFRISSRSFYQVNPEQTEILYQTALNFAELKKNEIAMDAYCGTGTIGICAAKFCKQVYGCELNNDAVRDAIKNKTSNGVKNIDFICADATKFIQELAYNRERINTIFMDPPRSGSTEQFIKAVAKLSPNKVVYVSCNSETLVRDLKSFFKVGYTSKKCLLVDMFPFTDHVESVVLLTKVHN